MKPIIIPEDTAIIGILKLTGIVSEKKIEQARKIVRGFSDYSKKKHGIKRKAAK